MALTTYRYRLVAPISLTELQHLVDPGATIVDAAGGPVLDLNVDDSKLGDLDELMARRGYLRIATSPVGTPPSEVRLADGTILTFATPTNGQTLQRSGTNLIGASGGGFDIRDLLAFDHFLSGNADIDELALMGWRVDATGTGDAQNITGEAGHPGILQLQGGTGAAARSAVEIGNGALANVMRGGANPITFECLISFRLTVAALALLRHQFGLGDGWALANPAPLTDGIYFRLEPLLSANVFGVCRSGGIASTVDMGFAPTLGNWYRLGFIITPTGTPQVQFVKNGVNTGSPVTTNLPAGNLGLGFRADSAGGGAGNNPEIDIDYVTLTQVTSKET